MKDLREQGFGCDIGFGETPAVIVIDMMNAFTDPSMPLGMNQKDEIERINRLLEVAHKKEVPVFFSVVSYDDENLTDAGIWYRKQKGLGTLCGGTIATEIDRRIAKHTTDAVINKKYASAFFGTDLVSRLNFRHIDTLIISGCTTSGCVRATAVDTIQFGYRPIVVEDCVADRSEEAHRQGLIDLNLKYADVIDLDHVTDYLNGI